jgi:hypothetical protein
MSITISNSNEPRKSRNMKMKSVHPGVKKVMVEFSEAISVIVDQYEFDFGLDGAICRFSYQHGKPVFAVSKEAMAGVEQLFDELRQFEKRIGSLELDPLEVSKFLGKYFRTDAKVWRALRDMRIAIRSDDIPIYDGADEPGEQAENAGAANSVDGAR